LDLTKDKLVRLYATQEWGKLNQVLSDLEDKPITLGVLVEASKLRIEGNYRKAREIVEKELARQERDDKLDTYLYLYLALSLADSDQRSEMNTSLGRATEDQTNILALITKALRTAEAIPIDSSKITQADEILRQEALRDIWKALRLNDMSRPDLVASIVGRAMPASWTFLLDAYAYVLMKAGHLAFSKALLTHCIYEDPYFSSPYLHLAEWCIADVLRAERDLRSVSRETKSDRKQRKAIITNAERSQRVGRLGLRIAIRLEGKREGLTKRRAQALLHEFEDLLVERL
jgi:hypothetical protein